MPLSWARWRGRRGNWKDDTSLLLSSRPRMRWWPWDMHVYFAWCLVWLLCGLQFPNKVHYDWKSDHVRYGVTAASIKCSPPCMQASLLPFMMSPYEGLTESSIVHRVT
jgi:hypothetical protein